jgi:dihydroorotase
MKRLYRNASIARADSPQLEEADVLVEGDRITGVARGLRDADDSVEIDCAGAILLPALFDLHVHAREPGLEEKENLASCAEAAINGGFTGFVMMPDTAPAIDGAGTLRSALESARRTRLGQGILAAGAITKGRQGQELAGIAGMKAAGCVLLSDGGAPVDNPQVLRRAMEYAREFGLPIACQGEVREFSCNGCLH